MVTTRDRPVTDSRFGVVSAILLALTVVGAALMVLRLDPRSATAGSFAIRLVPLIVVVRGIRHFRPPHPQFWWGLAIFYAAGSIHTFQSLLTAWSGTTVNYFQGSTIRFASLFLGAVAILFATISLLLVRRRNTARWALPDAVVMGLGLFTALLVVTLLPVQHDLGFSLGFWTEGVLVGLRNVVMIVVAVTLLFSEQIRSVPVAVLVTMFIVWGIAEPVLVQVVSAGVMGVPRTVLQLCLVSCTIATTAVASHRSMRTVAEPSDTPRPTWNVGRTMALTLALAAPVVGVWFQPPRTVGDLAVVLGAFLLLLVAVVLRMRVSVLQASRLLRQVEQQADRDELTGLPNRRHLYGSYLDELSRRAAEAGSVTLVVNYLDLDNLREVNDRLEHSGGDRLLRAVANALGRWTTADRRVIRVGGDEFVVLTAVEPGQDVVVVGRESETLVLDTLTELAEAGFDSSGSVGTSWGALDPGQAAGPEKLLDTLLQEADLAQSEAKRAGGARGFTYDPAMSARSRNRAAVRRALPGAWARGQMTLAYQSVVDLRSGEVFGAESLLRWTHPELGAIPPPDAIDAAIGLGLINELGLQIFDLAQRSVGLLEMPGVRVGVNVAAPQLRPSAIDALIRSVHDSGLAGRVWLEVTEQLLVQEQRHVAGALAELRSAGLMVAIDDFGTGYCGLDYLCSLPIDLVKLDKVFAAQVDDPVRRRVSQTVAQLADALGAEVVVEGIEDLVTAERMLELGCRYGQGYALRRPHLSIAEAVRPIPELPLRHQRGPSTPVA